MRGWAIDLGTTNTVVAHWDETLGRPSLLTLENICRKPRGSDQLEAPLAVPSSTHVIGPADFWSRVGSWRSVMKRGVFLGKLAHIGRPALEMNQGYAHPNYAPAYKQLLGRESLRTLVRAGDRSYTVRDVARFFVRELLAEVKASTGEKIKDVTLTTPIDAYESYRAELSTIFGDLGIKRVRFIDEPVAAAIGYGLSIERPRLALVIDFGGGTLHFALVSMDAKETQAGNCRVLAKEARQIGGRLVDRWLLEEFCKRLECPFKQEPTDDDDIFWERLMVAEACRVKESVFFNPSETFLLIAPEELASSRLRGKEMETRLDIKREDVIAVLEQRGLYKTFETCIDAILARAKDQGIDQSQIDDVLMVGGSTLLPGVYPLVENRFGRDRVRAWQPFDAVAYGASVFSAGKFTQSDFIVHDYAFVTYEPKTHEREYTVIIPRGTRFPTTADFWKRQLVPTCSLGEAERLFKLVICEIGSKDGERRFGWDASGNLHRLGAGKETAGEPMVVPLNESSPTLGYLDPPHPPGDRQARLEIAFGVNTDRWLYATVMDLKTKRFLMKEEPVVRLL